MNKEKLYEEKIEVCSKGYGICENVLIFGMILLGFLGMYPFKIISIPLVSILYVLFAVFMLLFMLRKHLCTHCYYYGKKNKSISSKAVFPLCVITLTPILCFPRNQRLSRVCFFILNSYGGFETTFL